MKKFAFSLERVLAYSAHTEEREKKTLAAMRARHALLQRKRDGLADERDMLAAGYREKCETGLSARDAAAILAYMGELRRRILAREREIEALSRQMETQMGKVLAARREVRSLALLKEKQLRAHEAEAAKQEERFIEEFVANSMHPA